MIISYQICFLKSFWTFFLTEKNHGSIFFRNSGTLLVYFKPKTKTPGAAAFCCSTADHCCATVLGASPEPPRLTARSSSAWMPVRTVWPLEKNMNKNPSRTGMLFKFWWCSWKTSKIWWCSTVLKYVDQKNQATHQMIESMSYERLVENQMGWNRCYWKKCVWWKMSIKSPDVTDK